MATIKPQQILLPQKVHIGDTAELRLTFQTPSTKLQSLTKNGEVRLSSSVFQSPLDSDIVEVINITLFPSGVNTYQVSLTFTPWKTGVISFPSIKVGDVELTIKAEEIVSLTQQYNTSTLQESASPLLLPGTTYKIYGAIVASLIILILIIILIIKRKSVSFFLKNKKLLHKYKKNKKNTIKNLSSLISSSSKDKEVSEEIQNILRKYLDTRFNYPFSNTITSRLMFSFNSITQGLLSDEKYEAFGEIVSAFIRTDYIRFSSNSSFNDNERKELIDKLITNIERIEEEDKSDD